MLKITVEEFLGESEILFLLLYSHKLWDPIISLKKTLYEVRHSEYESDYSSI
jgi:hypothetical protein